MVLYGPRLGQNCFSEALAGSGSFLQAFHNRQHCRAGILCAFRFVLLIKAEAVDLFLRLLLFYSVFPAPKTVFGHHPAILFLSASDPSAPIRTFSGGQLPIFAGAFGHKKACIRLWQFLLA